jgi:outer membrane receptor protein involved in Fe transport
MSKRGVWVAVALFAHALPVAAQTADSSPAWSKTDAPKPDPAKAPATPATKDKAAKAPAKPAAPPAEQVVTVTGKASTYQSSIDRRSYSVANDLQKAAGGSIGDVLKNIPSVDVDVHGNVSLRGSQSVTILIDGQPSAMMQGQSRADVIQQMPADQIERVEVMTNPSAAFSPEGTAGIINLITKKSSRNQPKRFGSLTVGGTTAGSANISLSQTYSMKDLTLTGGASYRVGNYRNTATGGLQELDPTTGALVPIAKRQDYVQHDKGGSLRGGVDYNLDSQTKLSAQAFFYHGSNTGSGMGDYNSSAVTGPLAQAYHDVLRLRGDYSFANGSLAYVRKLGGDDHDLTIRLGWSSSDTHFGNTDLFTYLRPTASTLFQDADQRGDYRQTTVKIEYRGPLAGSAKLVAGYELKYDQNEDDHSGLLGPTEATGVALPSLNNRFKYDQAVHAFYVTYQRPFGPFTVMPGLRLEEVRFDYTQVTSNQANGWNYLRAFPTLHVAYKLDDNQTLTASYSQRIQRPNSRSLNPYRIYQSPTAYSQGNPRLEPQTTDSYELAYEYRKKDTTYLATLFYRDNRKEVTDLTQQLGGGVLLYTFGNLGHSRNAGLELVANGQLLKTLSYNASATLFWNEIEPDGLAFAQQRSDVSGSARLGLDWTPTKADFFQLQTNARTRTLTAQGYYEPSYSVSLNYRHKFDDKLALVVQLRDPLALSTFEEVIDTPTLKSRNQYYNRDRTLYLGFTYALGTGKTRLNEGFDSGGGGGPGGGK